MYQATTGQATLDASDEGTTNALDANANLQLSCPPAGERNQSLGANLVTV